MSIFISSQYLILVNDFPHFLFFTGYMAVNAEAVDVGVEKEFVTIQRI